MFLRVILTDYIYYFLASYHNVLQSIPTRWFWALSIPKLKKPLRNFESWNSHFFKKLRGLDDNLVSYKKECTRDYPYPPIQVAENVFFLSIASFLVSQNHLGALKGIHAWGGVTWVLSVKPSNYWLDDHILVTIIPVCPLVCYFLADDA